MVEDIQILNGGLFLNGRPFCEPPFQIQMPEHLKTEQNGGRFVFRSKALFEMNISPVFWYGYFVN